jgi:hypothetical protein
MEFSRRLFLSGAITAAVVAATPAMALLGDADKYFSAADDQISAWLTEYKERCRLMGEYATLVHLGPTRAAAGLMDSEGIPEALSEQVVLTDTVAETRAWLVEQEKFDRAYTAFETVRRQVAIAQGFGYCRGRDGDICDGGHAAYLRTPWSRDAQMAWHNGYRIGAADRARYGH